MKKTTSALFIYISLAFALYSAEGIYIESDLQISSNRYGITFFNTHITHHNHTGENNAEDKVKRYTTAIIYSREAAIKALSLKRFREGPLHYLCLDCEEKYTDLEKVLDEINDGMVNTRSTLVSSLSLAARTCHETTIDQLIQDLRSANTICITFGAGISAGYVPTLIEFYEALQLQKVVSEDKATDDSIVTFIMKLIENRGEILPIVQREWEKVYLCSVTTTPAHAALRGLIDALKEDEKDIFIYSDNIDGIHTRNGIKLSETDVPEQEVTEVIYPHDEMIRDRRMFVLVCGQSFDFHGILSTIYSRRHRAKAISFYSLNISPEPIVIYEGLDVDECIRSHSERVDLSNLPVATLNMQLIKGSLHETLPQLYESYRSIMP